MKRSIAVLTLTLVSLAAAVAVARAMPDATNRAVLASRPDARALEKAAALRRGGKPSTAEVAQHLRHDAPAASLYRFAAVDPDNQGEDIGNHPWLGQQCWNDGLERCCYSSYAGTFVRCRCRFNSILGYYIWVAV
jgi:hypothetical protein